MTPRESSLSCPTNWDIANEIFPQGKLLDASSTVVTEPSLSPAGLSVPIKPAIQCGLSFDVRREVKY